MAFPAAPTEAGAANIHFLTTDGNAAAGWFGVDTGSTGSGSNTVGFAAVATHVHDDAAGAPGGLATTSVPMVLVGGVRDDALGGLAPATGDAVYLLVDANGALWTHDDALDATIDGAYLNVNANIAGTDFVGGAGAVAAGVQRVTLASNDPAVAKLGTIDTDTGNIVTAVQLLDDAIFVDDTATHSTGTTKGMGVMGVAVPTDTSISANDIGMLAMSTDRRLHVDAEIASAGVASGAIASGAVAQGAIASGAIASGAVASGAIAAGAIASGAIAAGAIAAGATSFVKLEDVASAAADAGVPAMARRTASPGDTSGADLDYEMLQMDNGRLWTSGQLLSGAVASGAVASGAIASGALASGSIATGALVDMATLGTTTYTETTSKGFIVGAVRNDALAALAGSDNEIAPLQVDEDGGLWTHPAAAPKGGCKMFTSVDLDESEEDPAAGPVTIYSIYVWNLTAAPLWLQMFNTNTVTVGTTAPTNNFMIPANADSDGAGVVLPIPVCGLAYSTALTVAITTGSGTDNGAPGAGDAGIAILYQD